MNPTGAIRRMLAAGLTMDQALIAADAFAAEAAAAGEARAAAKRAINAERQRRFRETRNASNADNALQPLQRVTAVTRPDAYTEDAHTYAEPEPNITTTPPTSEASASSAGAPAVDFGDAENVIPIVKPNPRGSRLPANWWPPPECEAWCREKFHLSDHELSEAVDEFRDFWSSAPGDRGRKCDWPATFRNACRKRFGQARRPSAARHGPAGGGRLAAYQRAAAHFSAPHDVPGERPDLSDHRGRVLDL
jgi:hypothetical protein